MRVAWTEYEGMWLGRIGPCHFMLREMSWSDPRAREHREAIDRMWTYSIRHYPDPDDLTKAETLDEGAFEVARTRYDGGLRQAQERLVEIARKTGACKRTRRQREALEPESIAWLEARLLDTIRTSYASWHQNVAHLKAQAAAGDRSAQDALYWEQVSRRPVYPEPRWSTARLAGEAAQYSRPDDLDALSDKRFYALVHTTLERLKRRGLLASSAGPDDRGRETRLWEPA